MHPRLQGFRLVRGKYEELQPAADGSLINEELGLRLVPEGSMLRLVDLRTGKPVLTRSEQAAEAQRQARTERRKAQAARRRESQERRRADESMERAEAAANALDQAKRRADQEAQRAAALAAEVERLQELLRKQSIDPG